MLYQSMQAIMKQKLYTQESFPSNKADLIERFLTIWDLFLIISPIFDKLWSRW